MRAPIENPIVQGARQGAYGDPYGIGAGAVSGAQDPYGIAQGAVSGASNPGGAGDYRGLGGRTISHQELVALAQSMNTSMEQAWNQWNSQGAGGNQYGSGGAGGGDLTVVGQPDTSYYDPDNTSADRLQPSGGGGGGGSLEAPPTGGQQGGLFPSTGGGSPTGGAGGNFAGYPINLNTPLPQYQSPNGGSTGGPNGGVYYPQQSGTPGGNSDPLNQYQNSANYQLLNAPGAFQSSPGYQYAVDDALKQVQRNAASRGLLESGAVMRGMLDRAQGMALQDYGNWWNRQSQQLNDYQNRLAGLAQGPTGSEQAYGTGTNLANTNMQTGTNLGSLFGNQGNAGLSGIVNTGAAQSNAMAQAAATQAQIQSANQSTRLAGAVLANQNQRPIQSSGRGGLF